MVLIQPRDELVRRLRRRQLMRRRELHRVLFELFHAEQFGAEGRVLRRVRLPISIRRVRKWNQAFDRPCDRGNMHQQLFSSGFSPKRPPSRVSDAEVGTKAVADRTTRKWWRDSKRDRSDWRERPGRSPFYPVSQRP